MIPNKPSFYLCAPQPLEPHHRAFFLRERDDHLDRLGLFWVRFQDDMLVLAPMRWKRHTAVKVVNQVLASLGLVKHPDQTLMGRIEKGFAGLGDRISPAGLTLATKTLKNFVARLRQLDEQEPRGQPLPSGLVRTCDVGPGGCKET